METEPPEHLLLLRRELSVGHVECSTDRLALDVEEISPALGDLQPGCQRGGGEGRVLPKLCTQHANSQRQVSAEPGDLLDWPVVWLKAATPSQANQQLACLDRGEGIEADVVNMLNQLVS